MATFDQVVNIFRKYMRPGGNEIRALTDYFKNIDEEIEAINAEFFRLNTINTPGESQISSLDMISDDMGTIVAGKFIASAEDATAIEFDDTGFTGVIMDGDPFTWDDVDYYNWALVKAGVLAVGASVDGTLVAGGGIVTMDDNGLSIEISPQTTRQDTNALRFVQPDGTVDAGIYAYGSGRQIGLVNQHANVLSTEVIIQNVNADGRSDVLISALGYNPSDILKSMQITLDVPDGDNTVTFSLLAEYSYIMYFTGDVITNNPITTGDLYFNDGAPSIGGDITIHFEDNLGNTNVQINPDGSTVINESGRAADFRVEGDTDTDLLFVDGSTDRVGISTNTPSALFDVQGASNLDGAVTINELGADVDFRVEGDTDTDLLFVDASTDRVGIGTATPSQLLEVDGNVHVGGNLTVDGTYPSGGSGGLTYSAQTVTTGNITGASGNHYVCTIAGMTADRDLTLPTPSAAGERIAVTIVDGDADYELIIKANAVEIDRLFIAEEFMQFVSVGTGAGDWIIEQDARKPSRCVMDRNTSQSISNTTWTKIEFDTSVKDVGNLGDVTTNHRITVRRDGDYLITGAFAFVNSSNGNALFRGMYYKNGSAFRTATYRSYSGSNMAMAMIAILWPLSAGDYIELYTYQDTGGSLNTPSTSSQEPFLSVTEII